MDKASIESVVEAAGGVGGRVCLRFRDFLAPKLNEDHTAVRQLTPKLDDAGNAIVDDSGKPAMVPEGPVVHEMTPLGHIRTVAATVIRVIDNHLALGPKVSGPVEHLIAFADIEHATPDQPAVDVTSLPPAVGTLHDEPPPAPMEPTA